MRMHTKTLADIVAEKPFDDFAEWWPVGSDFVTFMSNAIVAEWSPLAGNPADLSSIHKYTSEYIETVFQRQARSELVTCFVEQKSESPLQSGEFDALSYAFFRSAFELIEAHQLEYSHSLERERRLFTKRVGKRFFTQLHRHLQLALPSELNSLAQFNQLDSAIAAVGAFLKGQGYLRDHFAFTFDVTIDYLGRTIEQRSADLPAILQRGDTAYALYEMGYPIILPSAVYLYHTLGEAQHHSSRTIEELFERTGYVARETDDFDPIAFPSDRVVELWEIRSGDV